MDEGISGRGDSGPGGHFGGQLGVFTPVPTPQAKDPIHKTLARRFVLVRSKDVSGVSGTGVVAEGTVFSNGAVAYTWLTHLQTMAWAPSIDVLKNIHGHGGSTKVVFIDPENE